MKQIASLISILFFVTTISAKAEIGMGVTGAVHFIKGSGSETTRQSGQVNNGSHDETAAVPEIFVEAIDDTSGIALGLSYIPTRELGSKSRTDTETAAGRDNGTYTAKAELDNVIQIYADFPTVETFGLMNHIKLGVQHVTVTTLESLNSGSTYPNQDILGLTIGYGLKGDLGNNLYYKGELTYTKFEQFEAHSTAGNVVSANLDDVAAKFSLGYKF
jgi:hypothetical protein